MQPPAPELPACCTPDPSDPASALYATYNAAGDPQTAGLNYQGKPCPTWADLPENVQAKWRAVYAAHVPHARPGPRMERRARPPEDEPVCALCGLGYEVHAERFGLMPDRISNCASAHGEDPAHCVCRGKCPPVHPYIPVIG